ncbi:MULTISPECIES: HesB/YadR/YfhF family protein [unclassified Granulicatella]|uniref:HesB/YadR/YfhF family protein n=1 Tax=unclassified Granulicatella TaxID=2630493 RepID=UPI001073E9F8|nr:MULTISPECIES: iron-sulfur cluster biosynthesis protein [unclassified Granulicatella]MBF0780733.1 iron-sulfur cluster biosynthesis protein [Granulicatella sp. 19428wC4_WM01]TFU94192.1 iron-sulfur cluster biosynthesis protein [Granulicatella sp. WM01]
MKIVVSPQAHEWFKEEMGISHGRGVRFMGKVYGCSPIHESFSLAIEVNEPTNPYALTTIEHIPYYVEQGDEWFFEGYDVDITFDDVLKEPKYSYIKQ